MAELYAIRLAGFAFIVLYSALCEPDGVKVKRSTHAWHADANVSHTVARPFDTTPVNVGAPPLLQPVHESVVTATVPLAPTTRTPLTSRTSIVMGNATPTGIALVVYAKLTPVPSRPDCARPAVLQPVPPLQEYTAVSLQGSPSAVPRIAS